MTNKILIFGGQRAFGENWRKEENVVCERRKIMEMKRWKTKITMFCISICLIFGTGCSTKESRNQELVFQYQLNYWDVYDLSGSYLPDEESFEALATAYLQDAEELLGYSDWWKNINPEAKKIILNIKITPEGGTTSRASYGKKALEDEVEAGVTLSGMSLTQYRSDGFLAHELTHVMVGPSFSISLEDGLCQYVQGTIGESSHIPEVTEGKISFEEYFKTYHEYYKQLARRSDISAKETDSRGVIPLEDIISLIGKEGRQYPTENRMIWLVYSEAFCRYLIAEYGVDSTIDLITNGENENSYETILGKKLEELKEEWLRSVDAMEQKYTWEEIMEMEQEYLADLQQ